MTAPTSLGTGGSGSLQGLAADGRSIDALRKQSRDDPKASVQAVARQFEALFMQELLKSMRQASSAFGEGLTDNSGSQMGTEMLDAQYATQMSGRSGGLADVIARQLERQIGGLSGGSDAATGTGAWPAARRAGGSLESVVRQAQTARIPTTQAGFVEQHQQAAQAVTAETGIPSAFMLGQAAHETGWGRREIRMADGSSSHNLFGIKADPGWKGAVAEITTTEYVDGIPRKQTAKFRAYASYEDSFRDYARLIRGSSRYQQAYEQALAGSGNAEGFARSLQQGGYATDPAYAAKLSRVINTTLQLQRSGG